MGLNFIELSDDKKRHHKKGEHQANASKGVLDGAPLDSNRYEKNIGAASGKGGNANEGKKIMKARLLKKLLLSDSVSFMAISRG